MADCAPARNSNSHDLDNDPTIQRIKHDLRQHMRPAREIAESYAISIVTANTVCALAGLGSVR
jgi:hypothetical protein